MEITPPSTPLPTHIYAGDITLDQFLGRHATKPNNVDECNSIRDNAVMFLEQLNALLACMRKDGVLIEYKLDNHEYNYSPLNSGWRPRIYNRTVTGASARSWHIFGKAADLYDPEGALDDWCMNHQGTLAELGLYLEHPASTKGWCHVQDEPPKSGNRVFYP